MKIKEINNNEKANRIILDGAATRGGVGVHRRDRD
jgi:hypothetical protein